MRDLGDIFTVQRIISLALVLFGCLFLEGLSTIVAISIFVAWAVLEAFVLRIFD